MNVIATSVRSCGESRGISLMNCQAVAITSEPSLNFAISTGTRYQNSKQKEQVKVTECQFNY